MSEPLGEGGIDNYDKERGMSMLLAGRALKLIAARSTALRQRRASALREVEYWKSLCRGLVSTRVPIINYAPARRELPALNLDVPSAWIGIESILKPLMHRFDIGGDRCLEFGVEHGYSTVALSNFFKTVVGVDTFTGDEHTRDFRDLFADTSERLAPYPNIHLVRSDYRDWIVKDTTTYDLIHVDIVHTYVDTFNCGLWAAQHARCVLFHDTETFLSVRQAVTDIGRTSGKRFYNFKESCGLGILVPEI